MDRIKTYLPLALAVWIAFVFVQSLFYKFSGSTESLHIFQTIEDWSGLGFFEPGMRWAVGLAELVASILVLLPATRPIGGLMASGIMTGAIFFHLVTPLGVAVAFKEPDGSINDDGGTLFFMACLVFLSGLILAWLGRQRLLALIGR